MAVIANAFGDFCRFSIKIIAIYSPICVRSSIVLLSSTNLRNAQEQRGEREGFGAFVRRLLFFSRNVDKFQTQQVGNIVFFFYLSMCVENYHVVFQAVNYLHFTSLVVSHVK